jgi:hypothetical protein
MSRLTPSADGPQRINSEQNSDECLALLAAADAAHAKGQRVEVVRAKVAVTWALVSVVAAFFDSWAVTAAIVGVVGGGVIGLLGLLSGSSAMTANRIQEKFDIGLFRLPLRAGVSLPTTEEVQGLAREYKGPPKRNWYVDVTDLPLPYAVLLCQRENLQWDWQLRRRWASKVLRASSIWLAAGLILGLSLDWSLRAFFVQWLAPSAPVIQLAFVIVRDNLQIAAAKQKLALDIEEQLSVLPAVPPDTSLEENVSRDLMADCSHNQQCIYELRSSAQRVPAKEYARTKDQFEEDMRVAAGELRSRLLESDP